jgi:hypothetical protein
MIATVNAFEDLILRTLSTLIATLITVVIIAERQRRINNAKIELAARYIESIDQAQAGADLCKDVVRYLRYAEELIQEISWGRIARASKIDDVVQISRKLAHERHKHETLEKNLNVSDRENPVQTEIEDKKFEVLGGRVRSLKISFIDFIFIASGRKHSPLGPR